MLRPIVAICACFVLCAAVYTACLLAGIGVAPATACIGIVCAAWLWIWFRYTRSPQADKRLLVVAAVVSAACCVIVKAHGAYDAWLHWNSLAKYFSDPSYFRLLNRPNSLWHADYPPGLPAPTGFIWRLLGSDPELVPAALTVACYLCIPLLLCGEAMRDDRRPWLWIAALALFTVNVESVSQGLNQYADVPLALLFLLALMCWNAAAEAEPGSKLLGCGLMLGGCLLMKNEGSLLVIAFLLSRPASLASRRVLGLLPGLLPAAVVLILYKRYIPTPNDVVAGMGLERLRQLLDPGRYRIIAWHLIRFSAGRFPLFVMFFAALAWLRRKQRIRFGPDFICLMLGAAGYLGVYLTTDIGLEWLVPTSLNRLMMQLLPAGVYVAIRGIRASQPE